MRLPIPKPICKQSIQLTVVHQSQTDMYGKLLKDEPITIKNCIVQLETQYSGTNSNRQLLANGVVFLYADISTPFPTLTKDNLQSKVTYESNEYTVNTIDEYQQPDGSGLFGYKLGVL